MLVPLPLSRVASGNSIDFNFQGGLEKVGSSYSFLLIVVRDTVELQHYAKRG